MSRSRSVSMTFLLAAALAELATTAAIAQTPSTFTVIASKLEAPRGLRFGPDGALYVAEGGTGGTNSTAGTNGTPALCEQVPPPVGPYTGGPNARISKIDWNGTRTTVASGFPSTKDAMGDIIGVADVAFIGNTLYALVSGGGCSHGNPSVSTGIAKVDRNSGKWSLIADVGAFLKAHPARFESAGDFEPDGTLYSMIAVDGVLLTVEPNHGQVFGITTDGKIGEVIDISASEGHIVPTSIAAWHESLYVGNLNLFPINPQWARILTIAKPGHLGDELAPGFDTPKQIGRIVNSKAGFTTVVGVDFGPDGLLYALELSTAAGFPTPGAGKVVRVKHSGEIEEVITGLSVPAGMTFGPDGRLYISNFGAAPPGAGTILRFDIAPGW
jgi:hypothetical protein